MIHGVPQSFRSGKHPIFSVIERRRNPGGIGDIGTHKLFSTKKSKRLRHDDGKMMGIGQHTRCAIPLAFGLSEHGFHYTDCLQKCC